MTIISKNFSSDCLKLCWDCWNYKLFESQVPKRSVTTSGKVSYLINLLPLREKLIQVSTISVISFLNDFSFLCLAFCIQIFAPINQNRTHEDRNTPKQRRMYKKAGSKPKSIRQKKSEVNSAYLTNVKTKHDSK